MSSSSCAGAHGYDTIRTWMTTEACSLSAFWSVAYGMALDLLTGSAESVGEARVQRDQREASCVPQSHERRQRQGRQTLAVRASGVRKNAARKGATGSLCFLSAFDLWSSCIMKLGTRRLMLYVHCMIRPTRRAAPMSARPGIMRAAYAQSQTVH